MFVARTLVVFGEFSREFKVLAKDFEAILLEAITSNLHRINPRVLIVVVVVYQNARNLDGYMLLCSVYYFPQA